MNKIMNRALDLMFVVFGIPMMIIAGIICFVLLIPFVIFAFMISLIASVLS